VIFDFNYPDEPFSLKAQVATSHLIHIPERILNTITQLVKTILFALAAGLALGKSEYFNTELEIAGKRVVLNLAGVGTSLIGFFAPLNALQWQGELLKSTMENIDIKNGQGMLTAMLAV